MTPLPGRRSLLARLSGLRVRLVVAFLLVAAFAATATAAFTYREARTALLKRSQDSTVDSVRDYVTTLAPSLPYPPDAATLDRLAANVSDYGSSSGWWAMAKYENRTAYTGLTPEQVGVTPSLQSSVTRRTATAFQRVKTSDGIRLTVGVPVTLANREAANGRAASGVQVYISVPMNRETEDEAALIRAARSGAMPALAIALIPALLAAGSILRPVRDLQRATRRLAVGELSTRLRVRSKRKDELAELAEDFNHTAEALEQKVRQLELMEARARAFAADVSHELRTPLAAMTAVTDVLDDDAASGAFDADTTTALRMVSSETMKLTRLVDDLMEISRFDAKAASLQLDELDIAEAVRRSLASRAWQDSVVLHLTDGIRADVDPRRLDVVIANLVGNALKHGEPPVEVTVDAHVDANVDAHNEWVRITVADHGPGLPPGVVDRVFERFYKADTARARSEGSGLGMAITLENVRLHGGHISAANRPEGGAVFTVDLPSRTRTDDSPEEVPQ